MTRWWMRRWPTVCVIALCVPGISAAGTADERVLALSAGIGGVAERQGSAVVVFEAGIGFVFFEFEAGALSDAKRCRQADPPDNCIDMMLGIGVRHRFRSEGTRARPFLHVLGASYWSGTGEEETDFQYENLALQFGGGLEVRRPTSRHGIRLTADYRVVFVDPGRRQGRVVASYVYAFVD